MGSNATPTDEVPSPPAWLYLPYQEEFWWKAEWSACNELDPYLTRIWSVKQEINNALALNNASDLSFASGNSTVLN